MLEPTSAVAWGDAEPGASCDTTKCRGVARRMTSNVLLLQCPSGLDWIQIGRVRRHVYQLHPPRRAGGSDARIVVRGEVVHHEHVARTQLRKENGLQPSNEPLLVGCGEHGGERDPAGQSDRTKNGQVLPPVHWHALDEFIAAFDPCVRATHGEVHARFIEENELLGGYVTNAAQELPTLHFDVGAQTLQRPAAFFLTTYP